MISSAKTSFIAAFADELRRAREYSGIELADVARITRISIEYLNSLESGKWEIIPQPYLRGFLSQYAKAVGMNVEKVLQSFDQLLTASEVDESATLDLSSPLLPQPEHIGVTRAKIRTGWFTALTQNRKVAYLAVAVAVVLFGAGLALSRRTQRPRVVPTSFESSISEYKQTTRGPLTVLNLSTTDSSAGSKSTSSRGLVIGSVDTGTAVLGHGVNMLRTLAYHPYDSIV